MANSLMSNMLKALRNKDTGEFVTTPQEMKENQFGFPLRHYAQQYLFGATGLRIQVFNSVAGMAGSCKSTMLFDLLGHTCADKEHGGLEGIGWLFELEGKISPVLLSSILNGYGVGSGDDGGVGVLQPKTLDDALTMLNKDILPIYRQMAPNNDVPMLIGFDSIGGAASRDTTEKMEKEGAVGKGFHEKAVQMKHFCENIVATIGDIPAVFVMINQEKESLNATPYGPPQKHITGGTSQVFKDGHMISNSVKKLASGDGNLVVMKTTKTSFCDPRKIEVYFRWNKFGKSEDDYYGHHFDWALASANVLANPEKGVGEIRDICDVKVSDKGLVTSEKLGIRSVTPDEFEQALFDPANAAILNALYTYQKIDRLKGMDEYREYLKKRKASAKEAKAADKDSQKVTVTKKPAKKTKPVPMEQVASASVSMDDLMPSILEDQE